MSRITRNILILSLVSLLNDVSSEMLIPIMPLYLKSIGFTVAWIGILEGVAEATAGLSKIYFGHLSDKIGKRMPFVRIGYFMSAIAKSMLALSTFTAWIFTARFSDKLGKGVRTAARDAMLSDETTSENKGAVFGFHRAFDTAGAALGPFVALIFLWKFPRDYQALFFIAFIPSMLSVLTTFFAKEKIQKAISKIKPGLLHSFSYWRTATSSYKKLILPLLLFSLVNSSDAFLLLMMKQIGMSDTQVLILYIFYNLVFAALSFPIGKYADKIGLKSILIFGLLIYCISYTGMAITHSQLIYYLLFFGYGIYSASTDGVSKALISNLVPKSETATAIGFFAGVQSICILICNIVAGLLWQQFGAPVVFIVAASGALLAAIFLSMQKLKLITSENS
ncbi:MAG: MFS transporter [Sphingobacteriales bacterium]|nr:MAG: MFS transporter [Sphingobacteriales bacterium]